MLGYGLVCVLLGLTVQLLAAREAVSDARPRALPRATSVWLGLVAWTLGGTFYVDAISPHFEFVFWASQIGLTALFASSGCLLATWVGRLDVPVSSRRPFWRRLETPLTFPAAAAALVLLPWAWMAWRDFGLGIGRNTGASFERTMELARWGLGGALPQYLQPETLEGFARGLGWLPREVTVPMGVALVAAWWIAAFAVIVLASGFGRGAHARVHAAMWAPFLTCVALFAWATGLGGDRTAVSPDAWFDPRFFWPGSEGRSGIWTSSPGVMRSFGPMLCTATAATIVVAIAVARPRARRRQPTAIEEPRHLA